MATIINPRLPETLTPKWQALLAIRRHAVMIAQSCGKFELFQGAPPMTAWRGAGFSLMYKTPFQRFVEADRFAQAHGFPTALPFNLDIWVEPDLARHLAEQDTAKQTSIAARKRERGFKAVNVGWQRDDGPIDVATFQRGPWEDIFLALDPGALKAAQSESK
jgi:hypothetical protein